MLTPFQVDFVGVSRQMIERLIRIHSEMEAFVVDYDNQQVPLPLTNDPLTDAPGGEVPRNDAPVLNGNTVQALRDFCNTIKTTIDPVRPTLVQLSVRSVETILR